MAYILKDEIKINKPIIFLCGPYYNDLDKSDRRKILQDFFLENFPKKCLPLIIDDFLTKENIGDNEISIQLLEEIFAGISFKTYIFLDTMSSAVELGLFTNSAYNNSLYVMLPYEKERNCGNIGVFTSNVVLEDNADRITVRYYHPKIERIAFSTDNVGEFYKFINDCLPEKIRKDILQDYAENINLEHEIQIAHKEDYPQNDYCVNYQYNNTENSLIVFISVKLLFYIICGIVYSEYTENLRKKEKLDFDSYNIYTTVAHLKSLIMTFLMKHTFVGINSKTKVDIQTVLTRNIEDIVKHIISFIFTYHKNSRLKGYFLVGKNEIIKELELQISPVDFFDLTVKDIEILNLFKNKPDDFFSTFEIKTGYKKRKITTYKNNIYGNAMRELHQKICLVLNKQYVFDIHSYAYQKNKSVKKCIECHKKSKSFLKFDIHKFFNSIDKRKLSQKLLYEFELDEIYEEQLLNVLDICFDEEKMPIGLITSPILSDIYMKKFDVEFSNELGVNYIYTRYADDILVSSANNISLEEEIRITRLLVSKLKVLGLKMNNKKYMKRNLKAIGDYVKYLGINIVVGKNGNIITVGKTYKNYIAKTYLRYIEIDDENREEKFYLGKKIAGYLSFVNMIEGEDGLKKIYTRIEKSTKGEIKIEEKITDL